MKVMWLRQYKCYVSSLVMELSFLNPCAIVTLPPVLFIYTVFGLPTF